MNQTTSCSIAYEHVIRPEIAVVNLTTAIGLPAANNLDIAASCRQLDDWAAIVKEKTTRLWPRFVAAPNEFDHSPGQFRILVMITVLQRDLGLHYNRAFTEGPYDARDSRNLFIHGLLTGHGGTCVTMPVLYTAIGRRLGYPLKLVRAKEHMFCRWDNPDGERFNIEATSPGFNLRSDEHYLNWPTPITSEELASGQYLRSFSPRDELAFFLHQRGSCLLDNLHTAQAVEAFYQAHQLVPDNPIYDNQWRQSILIHRAVESLGPQDTIPTSIAFYALGTGGEWESQLYSAAQKDLNRILSNHQAKRRNSALNQECGDFTTSD